jgi:hypothetical protein
MKSKINILLLICYLTSCTTTKKMEYLAPNQIEQSELADMLKEKICINATCKNVKLPLLKSPSVVQKSSKASFKLDDTKGLRKSYHQLVVFYDYNQVMIEIEKGKNYQLFFNEDYSLFYIKALN